MNKKVLIQITLFAAIILVLILVFFIYKNENKTIFKKKMDIKEIPFDKDKAKDSNIIKNIEYFSKDKNDNQYKIKSEYGKIDPNQPRIQMGLIRHFKSYFNIKSAMPKIRKIIQSDELTTFKIWLSENQY